MSIALQVIFCGLPVLPSILQFRHNWYQRHDLIELYGSRPRALTFYSALGWGMILIILGTYGFTRSFTYIPHIVTVYFFLEGLIELKTQISVIEIDPEHYSSSRRYIYDHGVRRIGAWRIVLSIIALGLIMNTDLIIASLPQLASLCSDLSEQDLRMIQDPQLILERCLP